VDLIKEIGAFAGLAAFFGLALLALLSFTHGRDIRRLREWAGSAPERDAERKESTSVAAARRAEELRRLEEARTAEQQAIALREERRQRRGSGLPETTRGERLRRRLSDRGERLAEPRYLAAVFVAVLVVVGGIAYAVLHGSGGSGGGSGDKHGKVAAVTTKPGDIEVAVLNGTAVPGLAGRYGEKVQRKGFKLGTVTNSNASFAEGAVMYRSGHAPEARLVGRELGIGKVQPITSEIDSISAGAPVSLIVGENDASTSG
jgi:LytR cell envelope-related transcriptional attenuator